MSRLFDDASSQSASIASAIISGVPFSMSCCVKSDDFTNQQGLMTIYNSGNNNTALHRLTLAATSGAVQCTSVNNSGTVSGTSTIGSPSTNTWFQAGGMWVSTAERRAVFNGSVDSPSTQSINPTVNSFGIGACLDSATDRYLSGALAEAGIWDVALTDAEWLILAAGVSPAAVRPDHLIAYWPLVHGYSPEIDLMSGANLTLSNGPTVADHCPVRYLAKSPFPERKVTAAPPSGGGRRMIFVVA